MITLLRELGFVPRLCVWELTLACNLRCLHCGTRAGHPRADELGTDEALVVAQALVDLGAQRVTLGGGEPLLRRDWPRIASVLARGGVYVNLLSNGIAFSADEIRRGRDAGLASFAFSVDGLGEAHDHVRARPGSFDLVLRALDMCRAAGIPTAVVTHINRRNAATLAELRGTLAAHGVATWQVQLGNPMGNLRDHDELVVPPEALLELVPEVARLRALPGAPRLHVADNFGYYGRHERALRDRGARICFWIGCRAGCQVVGIESNGNIKGCLSLPSAREGVDRFIEGNVRKTPLAAIWGRPGGFAYNREHTDERLAGFCRTCRYRDLCRGGCLWTATAASGERLDNPYCFYRQAVLHGRDDLIGEDAPAGGAGGAPGGAGPALDDPTCLPS